MPISYHMSVQKEFAGGLNRCSGLPTHLPAQWPQIDGEDLSFLFQIYCDGKMLDIPNTLCIQGYQLIKDGDGLSDIVVVQLPLDAKENTENAGVAFPGCPGFENWGVYFHGYSGGDICFEEVPEQEDYDLDRDFNVWWSTGVPFSKLGGWCDPEIIPPGCRFLGWFSDEQPFNIGADYNFGLFLSPEGRIITNYFQV